ncbi:MAG: hypothetical protein L0H84_23005 [Pseudonocardia sp.]|nr:hypothetical protein [Pseudonocardia sp.]
MTDDEALLDELATLLRPMLEPPPEVLVAGRRTFGWRDADAALARLVHDSLLDQGSAARAGGAGPRLLAFEDGDTVVELQVDGRRLVGQVDPPAGVALELCAADVDGPGEVLRTGQADAMGRFVLAVPPGAALVTVRCTYPDGATIRTGAIRL